LGPRRSPSPFTYASIFGPQVEALHDLFLAVLDGHDDDGNVRGDLLALQVLQDVEAVPEGHDQVQQHEIGLYFPRHLVGLLTVGGLEDLVAPVRQQRGDEASDGGVVVGDQNARWIHENGLPFSQKEILSRAP